MTRQGIEGTPEAKPPLSETPSKVPLVSGALSSVLLTPLSPTKEVMEALIPVVLVDRIKSELDSGLTRGEAGRLRRTERSSTAARKGITPGFKATAHIPISLYGAHLAMAEQSLHAACCQSYR
jgi:hypothetical protein